MVSKSDDDLKIMLNRITLRPSAGVCAGISIPQNLGSLEERCRGGPEIPTISLGSLPQPWPLRARQGPPGGVEACRPA